MSNSSGGFIVCNVITEKVVADSVHCEGVVFLRDPEGLKSRISCRLINAFESDRLAMSWMFTRNKERLLQWKRDSADLFHCEGIDILDCINKDYFWARRDENTLEYAVKFMLPKDAVLKYRNSKNGVFVKVKQLLRLLMFCRPSAEHGGAVTSGNGNYRYGFYVRSADQVDYFSRLIEECGKDNCMLIANHVWPSQVGNINFPGVYVASERLSKRHSKVKPGDIRAGLRYFSVPELISILKVREKLISNYHANLSVWKAYNIKAVFFAAQEVEGFGNLAAQQGKQQNVVTVNTHNGTKSGDVYNRDNHFSAWCVWDEQMKLLLNRECGIAEEIMRITGHLRRDVVANYRYGSSFGSFIADKADMNGGVVIAYFSTYADIPLRFTVAEALIKFVEASDDARLLIRLHRKENRKDWDHFNPGAHNRVLIMHPDDDAGKNRLYDMFSVSDLTVCQGSTVAIESNWFGVDAITVENRDKSIIYSAGSESLVHVRDVETMLTVIRQKLAVRAERRVRSVETGVSVSRKIRDIAEELICNNEK